MENFTTGTGQRIVVHVRKDDCDKFGCAIHNPSNHKLIIMKTHWRVDRGLMERICIHGVGHPDPDDIAHKRRLYGYKFAELESIHGCDGCCKQ